MPGATGSIESMRILGIAAESDGKMLVGLFGHPVHHSKSPVMQNAAFRELEISGSYQAFDIEPEQLEEAVQAIRTYNLRGVNVTIPHKVSIMPFLDEITREAQLIGAVNTVINNQGKLIGTNTDGIGYLQSLREEVEIDLEHSDVVIIGAGGAARAIATHLALENIKQICISNRTMEKAEALANTISAIHPQAHAVSFADLKPRIQEATLVVNTTSVGMYPNSNESPIPAEWFHKDLIVSDLVYNPRQTLLLQQAELNGCRTHGGIGMLLYQGAEAFRLWTGKQAPISIMREMLLRA